MTGKQIIDEIDISKCEFCYSGEYCHIYSGTASFRWMCKENEDCQIKNLLLQLQAKEQECEELKEENAEIRKYQYEQDFLQQQLDQLKAENEKLKNNITSFDYLDSLTDEQVTVLYTASIDELAIRGYKAKYKTEASVLTRYHNALTEIKEIVTNFYETGFLRTDDDCILINNHLCVETLDKILQKINECEVGNE